MNSAAKKILGNGSIYTVATIAPILALLAVTPLVTSVLGSEAYGSVAVAISVYQLSSVLLVLGLPSMVTRDALMSENGFGRATGYVVVGSIVGLLLAAVACVTAFFWVPYAFPNIDPVVVIGGIVAGAGLGIITLGQAVLRAAERAVTFVMIAIPAALLPPILGLALLVLVDKSSETYVVGLAVGYLIVAGVSVLIVFRHSRPRIDLGLTARAIGVGLPTVPHSLSVPALLSIVISMALHNSGAVLAGQLQIVVMLGTAGITILNAVNNAWAPLIFKADAATRGQTLGDSTILVSALALVLIAGYAILGPFVLPLIGQDVVSGEEPVRASMLVAAAGAFHVLYLANIHLTFITRRTWPLAILTPLSALISTTFAGLMASSRPEHSLFFYAAVWPIFYLLQAVFAWCLAKVGPIAPARLNFAIPILILAAAVALQAAFLSWQPWATLCSVGISMALTAGIILLSRRRRLRAGPGEVRIAGDGI